MNNSTIIIKSRLAYDVDFLMMCILKLYTLQEEDEQARKSTTEDNGVGFNKSDAFFFTQIVQGLLTHWI